MRIIKCKEKVLVRVVAFLLLAMGFMHNGFTQCTLAENSYLFSHQTFRYGSWTVAADSIETVIPQVLCDSKPYRYFSAGTIDSSAAVSIDSMGNVSLVYASLLHESCQCCKLQFIVNTPIATSVTIDKNAPAALLSNSTLDELYLAVKGSDSTVVINTIARNGTVIKSETVILSDHAAKSISAITASDSSLQGFRICGSGGLLRFIPLSGGQAGTEKIDDIASVGDLVFANENYAILQSGAVYKKTADGFVLNNDLKVSVLYANDDAVISEGAVALLRNGVWNSYTGSISSAICANAVCLSCGLTIEYAQADGKWLLKKQLINDDVTQITSISPAISPLRSHFFAFNNNSRSADTITVVTSDIDSNTQVPLINIGNSGNDSFFNGITYQLKSRGCDVLCETGTAKVNSDTFRIITRNDSLYYEADFLLSVNNFVCNTAYWVKRKIRYGKPLPYIYQCTVIVGIDTVQISNAATVNKNVRNNISGKHDVFIKSNSLVCSFSRNKIHGSGIFSIWSLNGRMIDRVSFGANVLSVSIPMRKKDQMSIVRIDFSDGSAAEKKFINLR